MPRIYAIAAAALVTLAQFGLSASAQQVQNAPEFYAGVCTNFGWGYKPVGLTLQRIHEMGIRTIRDEALWQHIEVNKGEYKIPQDTLDYMAAADKAGIDVLLILNYGNKFYDNGSFPTSPEAIEAFCRYSEFVVKSFKGQLKHVEIWNEWDLGLGVPPINGKWPKGKAEDYVRLLKTVGPRLKAINPDLVIIGGVVSSAGLRDGWLEQAAKGGLVQACDVVSFHPYNREMKALGTPENAYKWMLETASMLAKYNGGKTVPVCITEMGWPSGVSEWGITIELQAKYLARTMLLSRAVPGITGHWWYSLPRSWKIEDEHTTYGMILPDSTPIPAFSAMAGIGDILTDGKFVGMIDTKIPGVYVLAFKMPDGSDAWTIWSQSIDDLWQVVLASDGGERKPVTMQETTGVRVGRPWDRAGNGLQLPVTVTNMPWIIRGDLSNVRVDRVVNYPAPESKRPQQARLYRPGEIGQVTRIASAAEFLLQPAPAARPDGAIAFDTAGKYITLEKDQPHKGDGDLSAWWQMQYDDKNLYLTVCVQDDQFTPMPNLWGGDSVQLSMLPLAPVGQPVIADTSAVTSLELALTNDGPKLNRSMAPSGKQTGEAKEMQFTAGRQGEVTTYRLIVPIDSLGGTQLKSGDMLAFSILVNDNDGSNRKGYVEWGAGIGRGKDPLQYNWAVLK